MKGICASGGNPGHDDAEGRALGPAAARAFAGARRHSRFVRFFKRAIPLGA